jgi:CRAL/TRIO domain
VDTVERALQLLRDSVKFHADNQTREYRHCVKMPDGLILDYVMTGSGDDPGDVTGAADRRERRKARIHHEMTAVQSFVTRGHDRDLRSVIFASPRNAAGDDDAFIDAVLFTIERAVACTEFQSMGRQDKMVAVMDCQGSTSPTLKACKAAVNILQQHYPGRLKNLIIMNLPYVLMGIYKLIKPFMDPRTAAKFVLVKGAKQTETEMAKLIDASQAMPIMIPTGQLRSEVDVETYLYLRPFFCLYDDDGKVYSRPADADLLSRVKTPSSLGHYTETQPTRDEITATASSHDDHHATKSNTRSTAATTDPPTTAHHIRKPVAVRTLAVGELVIDDDADDGRRLRHRVVLVSPVQG